ncbi:unnamed protein product [Gongylonema pulchrum]|uniref:C2H2-type domain-containing protein n=1 Tax=Gongylonema pulchrum TaxID=637853 RepID=A0A3P7R2T4_9BILA|nr:unnamed protein product [Gongylonema pulchrum]
MKPLRPSEDPSSTGSDNLQSTPTKGRFIWLEEHFTTRHAGKAQPYMCLIEGCTLRFTLKRALEEHLRTGHEKAKAAESDFMDRSVDEWIVMRLRQYERTNNPSFVVREPAAPRISGAAHRKRRRILTSFRTVWIWRIRKRIVQVLLLVAKNAGYLTKQQVRLLNDQMD